MSHLILVGGGSAGGKSTVVNEIIEKLDSNNVIVIKHDDYYHSHSNLTLEQRKQINYDHPSSLDNDLLISHINKLFNGQEVESPMYDFINHTRSNTTRLLKPAQIIIIEGILILENEELRNLAKLKIYVDSDDDTRLLRRIKRDINERGRSLHDIEKQYLTTVKPMYYKYIKPTKRLADVIINNDSKHDNAVEFVVGSIKHLIGENNHA